jgi:hypothetical protein
MGEIEVLVRDYALQCPPITAAELEARLETTVSDDPGPLIRWDENVESLTILHLRDSDRSAPPKAQRRWIGVAAAAAAAIVVVVGLVVADEYRDSVVTEPAVEPIVTEPAVEPIVIGPASGFQWSRVPDDEAAFRGARHHWMNSVTAGGPGLVAVGSVGNDVDADAAVWTSVDGITWSRVPHDEAAFGGVRGQWMSSVTVGGPGLVAVGSVGRFKEGFEASTAGEWEEQDRAAAVWTSVDGLTWSRVAHDEAVFGGAGDHEMNSVTVGGPGLVAVGTVETEQDRAAAVWTSVDGLTWTRVAHDEAVFGGVGSQRMNSVTVGGPGLVAVGVGAGLMTVDEGQVDWNATAAVWTSVDGLTWSRVLPQDDAIFGRGSQVMNSVVAGGPGLVAVGNVKMGDDVPTSRAHDAAVWTSVDGITWARVPHDDALFGATGNQRMQSVTVTDAGLVAVGADGGFYATRGEAVVWTSVDGLTWARVPHDDAVFGGAEMRSVAVADAGLVAVGEDSPETKTRAERENLIVSAIVWVAEPKD